MCSERVTIIIVNWNGEALLDACLESLSQQTYPNHEDVVVDNGSTDASVGLVRRKYPAVKVVQLPENKGFTGGNLEGLRISTTNFFALINNDIRLDPNWLENILQPMMTDSRIGICASKLIKEGTEKLDAAGDGLTSSGVGFKRGVGEDIGLYNAPELVFGASAAAALYRREMIDDIGFLDDDFFFNDEDTDLNLRAQLAGWTCMYVPTAIVYHKVNATIGNMSDRHVYYHTRNLEFVWIKNMPLGLMLRFAHHKLIQEVGAFCYLCLRHGRWRPFFAAKWDAIKMLPSMVNKRRKIQKKKRVSNRYLKELLTSIFHKELLRQKLFQFLWR